MTELKVKNLIKSYNGSVLLKDISFTLSTKNKAGLIGDNGSGKSTIKNILTGSTDYDSGSIGFIPENILIGVIDENLFDKNNHKSGGEASKKALEKVLSGSYDLYIMDEPTNHLDLSGIAWLERKINSTNKPMIIISHDRFFLDKVTNKTIVLQNGKIKTYEGNYSSYKKQLYQEKITLDNLYFKQQREIKSLKENIAQRKQWFIKAHNAAGQNDRLRSLSKKHVSIMHSKEKRLEEINNNLVKRLDINPQINIKLTSHISFKTALRVADLSKSFDKHVIFKNAAFTISKGEKVGIIGDNSAGKTTLLNLILGKDASYTGSLYVNPNIKISSFSQFLADLPSNMSIAEYLQTTRQPESIIRLYLGGVQIKGDKIRTLLKDLSMGEKSRVLFVKIILEQPDLIILDEPTNYMDISSREKIGELLKNFDGTVIIVSHDRQLITDVCSRILEIKDHSIIDSPCDSSFFNHNNDSDNSSDNLLLLQCRQAELSGILDRKLTPEERTEYEGEFLRVSRKILEIKK